MFSLIFGQYLLQYRDFPLSQVKNVLATPVRANFLLLLWRFFYCVPNLEGLLKKKFDFNSITYIRSLIVLITITGSHNT